jgi:glycosyltransferase involved in cell wall biosynthesis
VNGRAHGDPEALHVHIESSVMAASSPSGAERVPDVSVIVCTNRPAVLERFITSLAEAVRDAVPAGELIVVDDGSDPPVSTLAGIDRVIRRRAGGASAARNTGATAAAGDWLLFCDDDLLLGAQAIDRLWGARAPRHCLVPELRGPDGILQNAFTARWRRGDLKFDCAAHRIHNVAFPVSACLLVEKSVYWECGGMDERFVGIYYEDVMFGYALQRIGVATIMVDAVAVHHSHGGHVGPVPTYVRHGIFAGRWLFNALALRGWRRAVVLSLGVPRTLAESVRLRSIEPAAGYVRGLRRLADPARNT